MTVSCSMYITIPVISTSGSRVVLGLRMAADVPDPDPSGLTVWNVGTIIVGASPDGFKLPSSVITSQVPRVIDIHHTPFHSFLVACDRIIGHNRTILSYHRSIASHPATIRAARPPQHSHLFTVLARKGEELGGLAASTCELSSSSF